MRTAPLKPGRYVVRGGPGGRTALCRVTRARDTRRRDNYTDRWQVLASARVPAGANVTHYGMLRAVDRVWSLV